LLFWARERNENKTVNIRLLFNIILK